MRTEIERYRKRAREYLSLETDAGFRKEVERLLREGNEAELADRFYRDLEFGTGGLRGVIGGGYNRMNTYTVKRATAGLVRYILKAVGNEGGAASVVFAYDSRRYSWEFTEAAASVCAAYGVKSHVFPSVRPTPELSFAVRLLGASAGVVVTASHNPPEYNGYKVYWNDGAQVVSPHDHSIIAEVLAVSGAIDSMDRDESIAAGLYEEIGEEIDRRFVEMVESYLPRRELMASMRNRFSLVYTPLHGTGAMLMERLFDRLGIRYVTVPEQREPDGEFPTVTSPNPEEAGALRMAIDLAASNGADLVMATDPDADRLGVAVRGGDGAYALLTGNQLGSLLADYIFSSRLESGTLPARAALIKTIVTTELQRRIGESYGAAVYDVLTGFKYIGEKIREFESTGEHYVFGGEESYGYLVETEVRDKDSLSAAAVTAEMAIWCKSKGMTLVDYLDDVYRRFGYFDEILVSKSFPGAEGAARMASLIDRLRNDPPKEFAGLRVVRLLDYSDGRIRESGKVISERIDLPRSNVLQLLFSSGVFTVRPSGTEPKIKFYASSWADASGGLEPAKVEVCDRLEAIRAAVDSLV